jgi:hypothetical protein
MLKELSKFAHPGFRVFPARKYAWMEDKPERSTEKYASCLFGSNDGVWGSLWAPLDRESNIAYILIKII